MRKVSIKKKEKKEPTTSNNGVEKTEKQGNDNLSDEENQNGDNSKSVEDPLDDAENNDASELKKAVITTSKKKEKKVKKTKVLTKQIQQKEEENEEYEVQEIINHKVIRGKTQYLIRWKGYTADDDTWEREDTLSCPDVIEKYIQKSGVALNKKEKTGAKRSKPAGKTTTPSKKMKVKAISGSADGNEKEWEVEKIIDVHNKRSGGRDFLIRWKGYTSASDTWEPEENVNCPELLEKFLTKLNNAKAATQKQLRDAPKHTARYVDKVSKGKRSSKRYSGKERPVYFDAE